ncbi:MAG: CsbD family protein [Reyranella sp.]|nr:CsbD family protein [Reyranella sp.]
MSSTTDKIKGTANQAIGKVKKGVGEATDNPKLKGEGRLQDAKGKAQEAVGKAKAALKKAADL